jgi:iron complex outermembrane receptor protein
VPLEQLMYNFQVQSVYGASKHEQRLSEAPSSVSIIDAEEVKLYGHRNFAELLQSVRSIYISYDRNYSYVGLRGFNRPGDYSSRVLVLVNGHRVNENVFDSVLIGYEFPLDVDTIDRLEVIRGPSSSIYGNNAFFGVINVITKDAAKMNGLEVSTSYGSFESWKGRVSYGKIFSNDVHLVLSGSFYDSEGQDRLYYPEYNTRSNRVNFGRTEHTDYERYYKAFASVIYHDFTVEARSPPARRASPPAPTARSSMTTQPRRLTTSRGSISSTNIHSTTIGTS